MIYVCDGMNTYRAFQWQGPGTGHGVVVHAPLEGAPARHVVHSMADGEVPVRVNQWVVLASAMSPKVYSPDAFAAKFEEVPAPQAQEARGG